MVERQAELRKEHRQQMAGLEDGLLAMGSQVVDMLSEAMTALEQRDRERADAVKRAHDRVREQHHALQDRILRTLALQAPVASELRLVATYIHVNIHVERMAGLCRNIAKAVDTAVGSDDAQIRAQLAEMAQHARRVIERAMESFTRRDVELARTLPELDDPIDSLNRSIFRRTVEVVAAEGDFDWMMRMVLVARYLERLSDHAVAIGEQTIFAATGEVGSL